MTNHKSPMTAEEIKDAIGRAIHEMQMNNWDWKSEASSDAKRAALQGLKAVYSSLAAHESMRAEVNGCDWSGGNEPCANCPRRITALHACKLLQDTKAGAVDGLKLAPSKLTPGMLRAAVGKFKNMCGGYASLAEKLDMSYRAAIEAYEAQRYNASVNPQSRRTEENSQ